MTLTIIFTNSNTPRTLERIIQIREGRDDQLTLVNDKGGIEQFDRETISHMEIRP